MTIKKSKLKTFSIITLTITTLPFVIACGSTKEPITNPVLPPNNGNNDGGNAGGGNTGNGDNGGGSVGGNTNNGNANTSNWVDAKEYKPYSYTPSTNADRSPTTLNSKAQFVANTKAKAVSGQEGVNTYNTSIANKVPNNNNWDPSMTEAFGQNNFFKTTNNTQTTNFGTDLLNRQVQGDGNEKYYLVAGQKIPANTPFVKYAYSNQALKVNANGWSESAAKDYEKNDINKTFFPKQNLKKNMENTVPTKQHQEIYRSSVSIVTNNFAIEGRNAEPGAAIGYKGGTGWILDYQLTDDGSYPLVWYFATNAHVARNLYSSASYGNYGTRATAQGVETFETKIISFQDNLNSAEFNSEFSTDNENNVFKAKIGKNKAKVVYIADDFLKTKPHDFNPQKYGQNVEEIADFAVIEITFANEEEAKKSTHNYATWPKNKQRRFRKNSYLANPEKENAPNFYTGGFPSASANSTGTENPLIRNNKRDLENRLNPDLNTDQESKITNTIQANGSPLSNSRYHTNFEGYHGIIDPLLSIRVNSSDSQGSDFDVYGQNYKISGLAYGIRSAAMGGGSSGSMVLNREGEVVGIHFAEWEGTDVGFAIALVSERYIFSNLQDQYIPEYDLINGGGADQKSSYKQALAMAKATNANFKTNLFLTGLK